MTSYQILHSLTKYGALLVFTSLISMSARPQSMSHEYDQPLAEKTVTFEAVNPYSNVSGNVTVTVSGTFHGNRLASGRKAGSSIITGEQEGSFAFVPSDSSQPTFKGTFKFGLSGEIPFDRHNDVLALNFLIKTVGTDGSEVTFVLRELATINEYGADVSMGRLERLDPDSVQNAGTRLARP